MQNKFTEVKQLVTYLGLDGIGLNYSRNIKEIRVFILHLFIILPLFISRITN